MNICSKMMIGIMVMTMVILIAVWVLCTQGLLPLPISQRIIGGCTVIGLASCVANGFMQKDIKEMEECDFDKETVLRNN